MLYVDANATFPVAAAHWDRVVALLKEVDGNPSSIHARGRGAKVALERARMSVATMLGGRGPEIVFTSGATEANNLALQGVVGKFAAKRPSIVVSAAEHSSVIEAATLLEDRGLCELRVAPVRRDGIVDETAFLALVDEGTVLACFMHANNETGAINPVRSLAAARSADGVQAQKTCPASCRLVCAAPIYAGGSRDGPRACAFCAPFGSRRWRLFRVRISIARWTWRIV